MVDGTKLLEGANGETLSVEEMIRASGQASSSGEIKTTK
jgi:hypothetical protein